MKVTILGLGYVGSVSAGCLAREGHQIIGVDISQKKVDLINSGLSPIVEKGLDELIIKGVDSKRIYATTNLRESVKNSEICIICVGTPNLANGNLDMSIMHLVAAEIGSALKSKKGFLTVSIRSTVMPGTNNYLQKIIEKKSGKKSGVDFAVISNPEFLREGSAIEDFFNPPYTVIAGESDIGKGKCKELFNFLGAPVYEPDVKVAEMIKFLNNSFHALKVAFGNEVGRICKSLGVDSHELMELFVNDSDLNISKKYFMPGFSYGGSCLPKDLRALNTIAHDQYTNLPIFASVEESNIEHQKFVFKAITSKNKSRIGFLGLSFKAGTDDLRHSPSLDICEKLLGKGFRVEIFDENINLSKLVGKNKDFLVNSLPHIDSLLQTDLQLFIKHSEVIIFAHENIEAAKKIKSANPDVIIIDLVNIGLLKELDNYEGIAW